MPRSSTLFGGITLPGHPDLENIRRLDLLPIPQLRRMMRNGIAIDVPYLGDLSCTLDGTKKELAGQIASYIPLAKLDEFITDSGEAIGINVDSAEQIAKFLFETLHVGRGKQLKPTKGGERISTGKKQLEQLKLDHPVIPLILQYREASKLKSTYTDKLPRIARLHRGGRSLCPLCNRKHWEDHFRVHPTLLTTRTDTRRLACKDPNLQNIPARTKLGRMVRSAFLASKGYRLVSSDYAQIELRRLAHSSQDQRMIEIFRAGGDIHLDTAMRVFGLEKDKVDPLLHRAPCKAPSGSWTLWQSHTPPRTHRSPSSLP
jgi:DNA polymerase-1